VSGAAAAILRLADLDYDLPPDLVAQRPAEPRDASRLLVWQREAAGGPDAEDRRFRDLPSLLRRGDVLVRNDTRVFPARAFFRRATGGRIEVLFLRPLAAPDAPRRAAEGTEVWEALVRGRPRGGETLTSEALGAAGPLTCGEPLGDGRWSVTNGAAREVFALLEDAGVTPLPPYIHEGLVDPDRYQTVYARVSGSAAAPTAGLHFTPEVDAALLAAGVAIETVTLHVGLGTFKPLKEDSLAADELHAELYELDGGVWDRLVAARAQGRRIVAVGTTSMRVLEHVAAAAASGVPPLGGETRLFIRPGHRFLMVDGLLTNFHLPRTSLLALVMAFCGVDETRRLYAHAVRERYRFYSFGDAMLAL
jgi:S-adenosylmethionine:tRNA ribosyltransferase-isomerase